MLENKDSDDGDTKELRDTRQIEDENIQEEHDDEIREEEIKDTEKTDIDMEGNGDDEDREKGNEDDMEGNGDDEDRQKRNEDDMERNGDDEVEDIPEKTDDDRATNNNYALLSSLKHPTDPAHVQKHSIDHSDRFVEFCAQLDLVSQLKVSQKLRGVLT